MQVAIRRGDGLVSAPDLDGAGVNVACEPEAYGRVPEVVQPTPTPDADAVASCVGPRPAQNAEPGRASELRTASSREQQVVSGLAVHELPDNGEHTVSQRDSSDAAPLRRLDSNVLWLTGADHEPWRRYLHETIDLHCADERGEKTSVGDKE